MKNPIDTINHLSLPEIRRFFSTLSPPEVASLPGLHRGFFVGPAWLTPLWPPTLAITGLGGWWGKDIDEAGEAVNIVRQKGVYQRRFRMYPVECTSHLDGKNGLALLYREENPFPWPKIVDELRRIDKEHILGMTLAEIGPLHKLGFPFVLQRWETLNED